MRSCLRSSPVTNITPSSRRFTSAAPDGGDLIGGGLREGGERPVEAGEIEPSDQRRRLGQVAKPMTTSTTVWCSDGGKAHWMYCLPMWTRCPRWAASLVRS
jgi:hypothetical protein